MTFIGTSWIVSAFKSSAFEVDGTFINVRTDDDAIIADYIYLHKYDQINYDGMANVNNYDERYDYNDYSPIQPRRDSQLGNRKSRLRILVLLYFSKILFFIIPFFKYKNLVRY